MFRSRKRSPEMQRRLDAMRRGRERAAMAREPRGRMPDLPLLRRELIVIDYDSGQPVTHMLHFFRTARVDRYRVEADGKAWKSCGWSTALAGLRKAMQRLPSPRSDFWWRDPGHQEG